MDSPSPLTLLQPLLPKLMVMSTHTALSGEIRDMVCIQLGEWGTAGKSGCERSWEWGPDILTPHLLEFCQANPLQTAATPTKASPISNQRSAWGISELGCCTMFVWDSWAQLHNQGSWDSGFLTKHYFTQLLLCNSKQKFLLQKSLQPNGQNLSVAWQPACIILRFPAKLLKLIRCQTFIMAALINKKSRLLPQATSVNRTVQ